MCGIIGFWHKKEPASAKEKSLINAVKTLQKRGPDNQGVFFHNQVGMGHARLSIIDVSESANQPFTDKTGNFTIIFNGEIYNFEKLRHDLQKEGVNFRTKSDTEVLLELYKKHKQDTPPLLNGFFAFAIYNHATEELFICRDRIGIKPLFIYKKDNFIAFSSEIKAILEFEINKDIDELSMYRYFQLNYIPGPDTIFKHIKQIEPGTSIKIQNGKIEKNTYYKYAEESVYAGGYKEAQQKLYGLLVGSIQKRLISDVPVGTFLSGGIDSSIITSLTAKLNRNIEAFSVGFPDEPYFDETKYAIAVAKKAGIKHNIINVNSNDLKDILPNVVEYFDQPFADSSAIPFYLLSQKTRNHVTVALSGDGADELFGGYRKHIAHYRAIQNSFSNTLIKNAGTILKLAPQSRNGVLADKTRQAVRFSKGLALNGKDRYWFWASISDQKSVNKLLKNSNNSDLDAKLILPDIPVKHKLNHVLYADMRMLLPGDMLTKVDLMSMANSLEVRVPFLDHEVVDFAMNLPSEYKIAKNKQKRILNDTFASILPKELENRPKKGFEVPLLNWFRNDLNNHIFEDLLDEEYINKQDIFNHKAINALKLQLRSGSPGDSPAKIWALMVFQYWWRNYIN